MSWSSRNARVAILPPRLSPWLALLPLSSRLQVLQTPDEVGLMYISAPRAIPVSECLLRREAVENAVADLRLEGLAPTADAQLLFEQFVQGDLTEEQLVNAVLAR